MSTPILPANDRAVLPLTAKTQCRQCPATTVDLKLTVPPASPGNVAALPKADFLVVTWTQAETAALAVVFGKGVYKFEAAATTNFTSLVLPGMPLPPEEKAHAHFFPATVNGKSVICLKSEFHPKVMTSATAVFFEKILGPSAAPNFKYLLTSGTGGGIWANLDVGDVVVTNAARYGMTFNKEKQALPPYTGVADVMGGHPPAGFANWYDYATSEILQKDACVQTGLGGAGGRKPGSGKPAIFYKPSGGDPTDVVSNSRISEDECGKIATYRTLGATLDENDAYVADACQAVGFQNWASIRNVSDLPCSPNKDQYETFGLCSSINGAYAVWAFVMAH